MIAHLVRIGPWWLRAPLLVVAFPFFYGNWLWDHFCGPYRIESLDDITMDPWDFWFWPLEVWWAAMIGEFVPVDGEP